MNKPIGEQRPETETSDIEIKPCDCTAPIFANEYGDMICTGCGAGEFPKHNPFTYRVEEASNSIERSHFCVSYMAAKEKCPSMLA